VPAELRRLIEDDATEVVTLWRAADGARRKRIGLATRLDWEPPLTRPGVFGVGLFDPDLVAMAVAMPALEDDARSQHNVPGLAHISTVATAPPRWGEGLGRRVMRAISLQAIRRGFARVQLWTHDTNNPARQLYEREGFVRSGRERPEHLGEHIVHFVRELPALTLRSRPAARLLCLDGGDRLLLLHFRDPSDGSLFWEPPGGGLEAGETPREAVQREWVEETGLALPNLSPQSTYVARDLVWRGERWIADEHFFLARQSEPGQPIPAEDVDQDMDAYLGAEWVPWEQLEELSDPVIPDVLAVLRRLDPNGPWRGGGPSSSSE
jgi:8-oxo-dGTP pyrophosphatase MutT (NUDIX family)/GNAT superfamily N-acetyltransferase